MDDLTLREGDKLAIWEPITSLVGAEEKISDRRYFAVITHRRDEKLTDGDSGNGKERAGAFLFRQLVGGRNLSLGIFSFKSLALDDGVTFLIKQVAADSQGSGFEICIKNEEGSLAFVLPSSKLDRVQEILPALKSHKAMRDTETDPSSDEWDWMNWYSSCLYHTASIASTPKDVRYAHRSCSLPPMIPGENDLFRDQLLIICDDWIRKQINITENKKRFSRSESLRIRLCTFNVNGKSPASDFGEIVLGDCNNPNHEDAKFHGMADIIAVGLQEVDLSTEGMVFNSTSAAAKAQLWTSHIESLFTKDGLPYHKLAMYQLAGIVILVFCRSELANTIAPKDVQVASVRTGIMGMVANKGAVAVALTLFDGSIRIHFVNSHLAAFDENVERRNADYHTIIRYLEFRGPVSVGKSRGVFDCDVLFWLVLVFTELMKTDVLTLRDREVSRERLIRGIDLPPEEVREIIKESITDPSVLKLLQDSDQLKVAQGAGKAFEHFREGEIEFLPSYRFSREFDLDSVGYDIKRRPAWTDRVLYTSRPTANLTLTHYGSDHRVGLSDHKPVAAELVVEVSAKDVKPFEGFVYSINESIRPFYGMLFADDLGIPQGNSKLKIIPQAINFGQLRYGEHKSVMIELANDGHTPCAWRWLSGVNEEAMGPSWLTLGDLHGIVPAKSKVSLRMEVNFDLKLAQTVESTTHTATQMYDTLIMHDNHGIDYFVPVEASFYNTCVGQSISALVKLPESIRGGSGDGSPQDKKISNCPRELMRLIEWLMTNGLNEDDLFIIPGDPNTISQVRERLDTSESFNTLSSADHKIDEKVLSLSFASTLIELLDSSREMLIPTDVALQCADVTDKEEAFEILTSSLPTYLLNSFISVTAFLHFLSSRISKHGVHRRKKLADIFAPILIRDAPRSAAEYPQIPARLTPLQKRRFLLLFME